MASFRTGLLPALLLLTAVGSAQKKPLDHSVYDGWKRLVGASISNDGKWTLTAITPQEGDNVVQIRNVGSGETIEFPRGTGIRFTNDSKYVVATQVPPFLDARKARRDKVKPEDQPKNNLIIVDLGAKKVNVIERVASWSLATEDSGWIAYKPEPAKPTPTDKKPDAPKAPEAKPVEAQKPDAKKDEPKKKADQKPGDSWMLRQLSTEKEIKLESVATLVWSKNGQVLAYATSTKDGKGDGVFWYAVPSAEKRPVVSAMGGYSRLTLSNDGRSLAFTTDKDDYAAKKPQAALYFYDSTAKDLKRVDAPKTDDGFNISDFGSLSFSDSGERLFFPTGPKPAEDSETPDDEKVSLDVWNYQDPILQPQQLLQQKQDRERTYDAIYFVKSKKTVQLENPRLESVTVSNKRDGEVALALDDKPYRKLASWDTDYNDVYLVNVQTGQRTKVYEKLQGSARLSPQGKWLALFDEAKQTFSTIDTSALKVVSHESRIRPSLFNELNDLPDSPSVYGLGGWTKNEDRVLVYDRYDVWSVDPTGDARPQNLTNGRDYSVQFRVISLDREDPSVNSSHLLLSAFRDTDKQSGVYRLTDGKLNRLVMEPKFYSVLGKAKNADTLIYTREDIDEYPELYVGGMSMQGGVKTTNTNPQQANYIWPKSELVEWIGNDGQHLQGILLKPDNFDASKKYPMITYFYERNSDNLHRYTPPAPSASTVNTTLFTSQGYLVFIPDIDYKVGYPGESAVSAIVPGVQSLLARGYVDEKHLGIQGQSWGGYQVGYLVTETNMFACGEAGAPVSDMISAYGGIRYGSGLVRQFQYERQQSRIGKTPWDGLLRYIENSPIFFVDKIQTPLMIMSNDKDGAVPHTQGIEFFTAMRRLNKPCWMVVYNGEDHNLVERKNRKDLSIRLSQFFDHFLKGSPMPVWMSKGLPAVDKGRTMGTGN